MRSPVFCFLLVVVTLPWSSFAGEFRIFAPSRERDSVLVVDAVPRDSGIELSRQTPIEVGFGARTITRNPEGTTLFVSGSANDEGENAAVIHLEKGGDVRTVHPVKLDRDYSYLSLDRSGKFLLCCNYGGGQIDVYPLGKNALPGARVGGLDEGRKNAHCVLPSPDNRFVYIPYVKDTNALFQYAFDAESGSLTALEPKDALPPGGTGPRHMAYHPQLPIAYFSEEQGLGVSIYQRAENGQLSFRERVSAAPEAAPEEGVSSSDILLMPDGKFLYAGIRGHKHDFDFITCYAVKDDGGLEPLGAVPADKIPWGLTASPDGRYVIATGFGEGRLMVFQVGEDGMLTRSADLDWDKSISDVEAIAVGE